MPWCDHSPLVNSKMFNVHVDVKLTDAWLLPSSAHTRLLRLANSPLLVRVRKVTVFTLYAMAIRSVIATVGQPLGAAEGRRMDLLSAAQAEKGLLGAAAAAAADGAAATATSALSTAKALVDDAGGVVGPAAEAYAREVLEPLPFPYLPSVGALLLLVAAVAAHTLLVLGKKWSVRFHAW